MEIDPNLNPDTAIEKIAEIEKAMNDAEGGAVTLHPDGSVTVESLTEQLAARDTEIERLSRFIAGEGFRRCDIPACNCNSFHGGLAHKRLSEIYEALGGCDGTTPVPEIGRLIAEIERLQAWYSASQEAMGELATEHRKLFEAAERLREVLEWYAESFQYVYVAARASMRVLSVPPIEKDGGKRARAALATDGDKS